MYTLIFAKLFSVKFTSVLPLWHRLIRLYPLEIPPWFSDWLFLFRLGSLPPRLCHCACTLCYPDSACLKNHPFTPVFSRGKFFLADPKRQKNRVRENCGGLAKKWWVMGRRFQACGWVAAEIRGQKSESGDCEPAAVWGVSGALRLPGKCGSFWSNELEMKGLSFN